MPERTDIKIENKLKHEKRGINVYHHSTRSAHIISYDSSIRIPLKPVKEGDYLHISVVRGPGNLLKDCFVILPSWADCEFSCEGKVTVTHYGDRTILKSQPGPPTWQLKMTYAAGSPGVDSEDIVIVSDRMSGFFS